MKKPLLKIRRGFNRYSIRSSSHLSDEFVCWNWHSTQKSLLPRYQRAIPSTSLDKKFNLLNCYLIYTIKFRKSTIIFVLLHYSIFLPCAHLLILLRSKCFRSWNCFVRCPFAPEGCGKPNKYS